MTKETKPKKKRRKKKPWEVEERWLGLVYTHEDGTEEAFFNTEDFIWIFDFTKPTVRKMFDMGVMPEITIIGDEVYFSEHAIEAWKEKWIIYPPEPTNLSFYDSMDEEINAWVTTNFDEIEYTCKIVGRQKHNGQ